jgi:SnoaL-like domain
LVAVRFVDPPKSDLLAAEEFKFTIGDTAFDAADRLAIINLFGAYAYTYDENELDEFRALFTDSPELVLRHEERMLSQDIDTVMNFLAARKAAFKAENHQRRHALKLLLVHPPKRH